jgi:hypothetical protein
VIQLRKFAEVSLQVLMEKVLKTPEMLKFVPDLPKSHKMEKTYITAVGKFKS